MEGAGSGMTSDASGSLSSCFSFSCDEEPTRGDAHPTGATEDVDVDVDEDEPLLRDPSSSERYTMFPIRYPLLWRMYKQSVASFWTVEEVDLTIDVLQWRARSKAATRVKTATTSAAAEEAEGEEDYGVLCAGDRHFIKHVLAFFAAADGIVIENLALRFMKEVPVPEVRAFYGFQIAMENVHSEMYSLMLQELEDDPQERERMFRAVQTVACVGEKAEWAIKWISSGSSFAQRLVAFACVEGIFFSGSFCAIFWLKKRGLMPGLCFANELISRDEGLHTEFACMLYDTLRNKLADDVVEAMVDDAIRIERNFICDALPCDLLGMNKELMFQYITYVADHLLTRLGYGKKYNAKNPFDWMEMISLQGKTNFFERKVGEYQKASVMTSLEANAANTDKRQNHFQFTLNEEF